MTDRVCVGAVAGSYGVRGEVRLKSFTAEPEAVGDYGPVSTEDGARAFSVEITRAIKNGFAAKLSGIRSKEAAEALKGTRLYVPRTALPGLPDDEFYHSDLIGLQALDTGGGALGQVHAVHNHGATDLLELRLPGSNATVLVPFAQPIVPTVDLTAKRVIIDPPEGLFPEDKPEDERA
ncbi:MAG: ribosome maturation factor RimM [Pseudomonadota bacterium]